MKSEKSKKIPDHRIPTSPKDVKIELMKKKRLGINITLANFKAKSKTFIEGIGFTFRIKK